MSRSNLAILVCNIAHLHHRTKLNKQCKSCADHELVAVQHDINTEMSPDHSSGHSLPVLVPPIFHNSLVASTVSHQSVDVGAIHTVMHSLFKVNFANHGPIPSYVSVP